MKILVLGGTQFVGRHIVEHLVEAGHVVSVFNRGRTRDELPAAVERLCGDRDRGQAGLAALSRRLWDACIDVSGYTPRQVRPSTEILGGRVGHYVFISAVSVYGDPPSGPVEESQPCLPPADDDVIDIDARTYGPLKAACEIIVEQAFGRRSVLLRPQIVAGPYDPLDRFSYWVRRAAQGGRMLAPGDGGDYLQLIDARDVARFTRAAVERGLAGPFNLAGPRLTWRDFLSRLGAPDLAWVGADVLRAAGLTEFELPLYRQNGGPRSSLMHVSNARAQRAGLVLSDLKATIHSVRQWLPQADLAPALAAQREAELLRAADCDRRGEQGLLRDLPDNDLASRACAVALGHNPSLARGALRDS